MGDGIEEVKCVYVFIYKEKWLLLVFLRTANVSFKVKTLHQHMGYFVMAKQIRKNIKEPKVTNQVFNIYFYFRHEHLFILIATCGFR